MITRRRYLELLLSSTATGLMGCSRSSVYTKPNTLLDTGDYIDDPDTGTIDTGLVEDTGEEIDPLADTGPDLADAFPRSVLKAGETEQDLDLTVISGTYPEKMAGHVFIVHPVPYEDGSPVLLGDGVINRIDLGGSPKITRRMLRTPCHYIDEATKDHSVGFGNNDLLRFSGTLGKRNFPNTGILEMNGRLIINSDAGAPWEIDPSTLEMLSQVGWTSDWKGSIPEWMNIFVDWPFGLTMTSAHPVYDPQEEVCLFPNWGMKIPAITNGYINLLSWDGESALQRTRLIKQNWLGGSEDVNVDMSIHQMAVTSDHVIVMDTAFQSEIEDVLNLGDGAMRPQKDFTKLFIFDKQDLNDGSVEMADVLPLIVEIPREAAHFVAEYDSSDGILKLHVGHQCANDPSEFVKEGDISVLTGEFIPSGLHGMLVATTDMGVIARYDINAQTGTIVNQKVVSDERLYGGPALYTFRGNHHLTPGNSIWWLSFGLSPELRVQGIEEAYDDYAHRLIELENLPAAPPHLTRVNSVSYEIEDSYAFPAGRFASSPTFVPSTDESSEADEGYIVCVVLSDDESTDNSTGDEIWIFDALNLQQGPICRLGHSELNLPLTLHTCYLSEITPRTSEYAISVRDDLAPRIASLDEDLLVLFEQEVFSRFD